MDRLTGIAICAAIFGIIGIVRSIRANEFKSGWSLAVMVCVFFALATEL